MGTTLETSDTKRTSRKGRPNYPIDFKRGIAALACKPDVSVSKLALKHGINANLIFKWRRHYRAGRYGAQLPGECVADETAGGTAPDLLPVLLRRSARPEHSQTAPAPLIEIELTNAMVRVRGEVSRMALLTVLDCLAERT
ncbi:transposase [Accumulibacter sp.]|uniref:IS66-like element accessory protein TnpA n=1 Tax=Accumulibacter sp. TaxID=2053492 RepID=UPI0025F76BF6|nr:transposase [Accumulibacter sp.]